MNHNLMTAWLKYEKVRRSGVYNMITEWQHAAKAAKLSETQYSNVIRRYSVLKTQIEREFTQDEIDDMIERVK
ncbi:MAG: hypothetical protein IJ122_06350 [Methanobrevibacter sp.]|nr:hypothetical protein [Methanobrevibacter sp.]